MIFVDEARIHVKAGDGGKGCESFYRDRYMRYPRPDGGDGGKGGGIICIANKSIQTLLDYKFKQHYKAKNGGHASSKGKTGRSGEDCVLRVPIGTIIRDKETSLMIKDLTTDQQSVIVARGGSGGIGNENKKELVPPGKGEERTLEFELKLIADVGIIGFPNAGKSTLISNISRVKSKIANYPFTTKKPILGIVKGEDFDFVVADLPGIIEGAHKGKGLGDRFLKHAERTKILIHLINMGADEGRDPLEDYEKINHEIEEYSDLLSVKNRINVANKMDLPEAKSNLERFKQKYKENILSLSAVEGRGISELIDHVREILCQENYQDQ